MGPLMRDDRFCTSMQCLRGGCLAALCLVGGCMGAAQTPLAQPPAAFRLWCAHPPGYYPQVQACPEGWTHRASADPAPAASPPLLVIPVQPPTEKK
ncbi:hypothetical protein CJO78_05570 [Ralstonia solanacearum]|nr:hypothetical protein CJO76_05070 [Ralstonia solanacearum]AXV85811.1 hypothetical protein CJO78_05570 [Ralstonia solanacearum]AXV92500.1 hypothetical protein CJO79_05060 [Ralstonia solanacearum]AXW05320.1 hypothetical protein CJO82_05345 [Ralstonia solanacearum]AXW23061.1 hypothetical protein CJO86_05350 [Ralstonia solanacearum]